MNPGFLIVFWLSAISAITAITTDRFDALWAHHEWDQWAPENDGGDRFLVWQIWERIGNQWGGSWVLFWGRKGSIQTLVSNRFDIDTETRCGKHLDCFCARHGPAWNYQGNENDPATRNLRGEGTGQSPPNSQITGTSFQLLLGQ